MNEPGEIVGMVDVLKLTYATLEQVSLTCSHCICTYSPIAQINTMSTGDSEGPAWNKFWLSLDNDTESMMSGEGSSHRPHTPGHRSLMSPDHSRPPMERVDSVLPSESASHNGDESPEESAVIDEPSPSTEDSPFPFKFKAPSGRVHRLQVTASSGLSELIANVTAKLGAEIEAVGGEATYEDGKLGRSGYALSYLDDEGDTVSITTDRDLVDAINLARQGHREKVDMFVHNPTKPPLSATLDPHPALARPPTPPASTLREKSRQFSSDEEDDALSPMKRERKAAPLSSTSKQEQQVIPGLPNDLLLPGAIATLAVVIVGVFALSRSSSR